MTRFLWSQLIHRRSRTLTLGVGILVAAVSFTLLTSAVATSQVRVIGTIEEHFRPAYDILVRPAGSFTELERREQLVQQNYLSGIFGGITFQQYREIRRIPGVEVAAPIANIGYTLPFRSVRIPITRFLSDDERQMYRLRQEWLAHGGSSSYQGGMIYVYYTTGTRFALLPNGLIGEVLRGGRTVPICVAFSRSKGHILSDSPFNLALRQGLYCYSKRTPEISWLPTDEGPLPGGEIGAYADVFFPIPVAAIDPAQEIRLVGLDRAVVAGRILRSDDRVVTEQVAPNAKYRTVPILVSARTYLDETLRVVVERLDLPSEPLFHKAFTSDLHAYRFLNRLQGHDVGKVAVDAVEVYDAYLQRLQGPRPALDYDGYWTSSPVTYRVLGAGRLAAIPNRNAREVYRSRFGGGWAPQENRDTQFRRLTLHRASNLFGPGNVYETPGVRVIGTFDPELLPGFSPLSEVPLETYYPPAVYPADAPSRRALGGGPLLPTQNLGDYVSQPPLMLTNLRGLRAFTDPTAFEGANRSAPISVIRVRVAGVTGPDEMSRERIRRVAELIHQRTGLAVDITAGSSPRQMLVELPPGKFGRPALLVREGWVEKGVAIRFLSAVDRKSLALFVLVLVVCAFFLANAAFASVRARRAEIGTLLCLGWGRGTIFRAVLGELALVGLVAGVAGTALAAALVGLLSLQMSVLRTLLVAPIAVVLAVTAGALPALRASRSTPLDAVRPAVVGRAPRGPVRGVSSMAVVNLRRVRSRALLGAGGLFVAVGALALLLSITLSFRGVLVGTLLGEAISIQVRGVDLASVALAVALGGLSVADVLFLNLRERAPELVTLRASGWEERHLSGLVAAEGLGMGILGAVPGAAAGVLLAWLIGGIDAAVVLAGVLGAGVGILVALAGSAFPALLIGRMTPPAVLAEE
ncbi:MAG TPA: FtsX-like permease family protein [Actinomycetota bacterium]|nr:FtsX-like permease family protein [Actinomycetota bacterium]